MKNFDGGGLIFRLVSYCFPRSDLTLETHGVRMSYDFLSCFHRDIDFDIAGSWLSLSNMLLTVDHIPILVYPGEKKTSRYLSLKNMRK